MRHHHRELGADLSKLKQELKDHITRQEAERASVETAGPDSPGDPAAQDEVDEETTEIDSDIGASRQALKLIVAEEASLRAAMEARAIDAIHPQDAQSGLPPNWHGVIFVCRSADNVCVVSAKTQSCGPGGGEANCRITDSGMSSFGYCFRNCVMSAIARARSS